MTTSNVKTRFAPSPTGYLHLGGARTALFSWAFARHHQGQFVLRIEDTDLERSTPEAVEAILQGMQWLGLDHDEGPYYQTKRFDLYKTYIQQLLDEGKAYYCYSSPDEVEVMRETARAKGLKPKYDGTWRPEPGKTLAEPPADRQPVVRFKNPLDGVVMWNDMVKGPISIANSELDDLIIARPDGTPTYNFCVVVDDWEMGITHVIRGDDLGNNTPRQINILEALGAEIPTYCHLPMILGPDGQKLSKRHGAVSVMEYHHDGYLPEAMINYLARLGWSHGDDEIFSREQFIQWFNTDHLSKAAAQWDPKKLNWINAHYIKNLADEQLVQAVLPRIEARNGNTDGFDVTAVLNLFKDRAETLEQLADSAMLFFAPFTEADDALKAQVLTTDALDILADFKARAEKLEDWSVESLATTIKETLNEKAVKMPALGIPIRVATTGQKQTPSVDAVLALLGRDVVLERLNRVL